MRDPDRRRPGSLVRELQDRFPRAALIGDDAGFEQRMAQVIGFVDAPRLGLDLPLDVRGTAFQQRVWQALRDIPPGTTVSYAELARRIGAPKSARAVAGACAANLLAVAIPCHRVVRSDGGAFGLSLGRGEKARAAGTRSGRLSIPIDQDQRGPASPRLALSGCSVSGAAQAMPRSPGRVRQVRVTIRFNVLREDA